MSKNKIELKKGDVIVYNDGHTPIFQAIIVNITSTTKAQIRALKDVDNIFTTNRIINTYRRYMKKVIE